MGGLPEVFLNSDSPILRMLESTDPHEIIKKLVEISIGVEHFHHVYNIAGWHATVHSGGNFRVNHPRHDGSVWMMAILYNGIHA